MHLRKMQIEMEAEYICPLKVQARRSADERRGQEDSLEEEMNMHVR